jgi:diaminopimelate decarboxylase
MSWIPSAVQARVAKASTFTDPIYFVLNLSEVKRQVESLQAAFPKSTLHSFAAKANPLLPFLEYLNKLGMGCECASIGEFTQAARAFPGNKIVFDSPCKTPQELKAALYNDGGYLNIDNFQELERVAALHAEKPVTANVGMRVNAQLGAGSIGTLSTGTAVSKFGTGLNDCRSQLAEAYKKHSFLNMIHIHSGSQGLDFAAMTNGIRAILDFVNNDIGGAKKCPIIDIGGGLSVNFNSDEVTPTFGQYADALKKAIPELFDENSEFKMITEFGRAIVMKAGIYVSRIEYTKTMGGRHIILQHVGADLLLRTAWAPQSFPLRVELFNSDGSQKTTPESEFVCTDVAGPCCFGGDLVCKERMLPIANPGEYVVVKDVGGYYMVSYNYYNLRQHPASCFFDEESKELRIIRRADTIEDTLKFFDKPPQ